MSDTLCWKCKKATGFCSWSHNLTPVEGWKAKKGKYGYIVKKCPQFESDKKRQYEVSKCDTW